MTAEQERLTGELRALGIHVWGPTAPDLPHLNGVVARAGLGNPALAGYAVTPCGRKMGKLAVIVERQR